MAKLYGKLKSLEFSCESKPVDPLTKQKWNESLFIIRGKDEGISAWHYILVPHNQINQLKNSKLSETIDCTKFGSIIEYLDNNGQIYPSSGWGQNPPKSFQIWIENNYGDCSFDENTKFEYENDDIRLCTMQRVIPSQLIGIYRYYNKQGHFHYIKLFDDFERTLAYRSGIRNYDRFISLNGINIENETLDQITKRFKNQLNLPVQMLVCSPSTYHYYKSNNIIIHQNLATVQHLKPVFDISLSDQNPSSSATNDNFCVIQWEDSDMICIVPQSSVFKSSEYTQINDICFIEIDGKYRRGIIKFIGSKDQCENVQSYKYSSYSQSIFQLHTNIEISSSKIISNEKSIFEDLPNEFFYDLFNYLTIEELHNCFSNINSRFNNLLLSRYNVSFLFDDNINFSLIKFYAFQINHLTIDTKYQFDLSLFPNLYSLIISNRNSNNIKQIRSSIFPNLVYLSFLLKSDFQPPIELVDEIFSNKYQSLRYVKLGFIQKFSSNKCSISSSIYFLSINCDQLMIIEDILRSCPNLNHLQIHIKYNSNMKMNFSSLFNHSSLQRFTLWSEEFQLRSDFIDNLLNLMPNIEHLYLQTICRIPFIHFLENISKKLNNLNRFNCFIKEFLMKNERIGNLNDIHKISSCFKRIQFIKETQDYRIFATD